MIWRVYTLLFVVVLFTSCQEATVVVPEPYQPSSAYDAYRHGLVELGLEDSELLQSWLAESDSCLSIPTYVRLPYKETMFFDDLKPRAFTYRMRSKRGQKIEAYLSSHQDAGANVFLDLFQVTADTLHPHIHIASADSTGRLGYEPQLDGEYILRLQPELLKGGRYTLEIKEVTVFAFPMSGRTETAILSIFGAERDAGRRVHEGNDIFASRHVPIIAATSGTISYAGERGLGGKQIYITDPARNLEVYFAHLESIIVVEGQEVIKGDTIATNGNSGNAQTTNPHLHFGIYADTGAIDPYHYIVPNRRTNKEIKADQSWTGKLVRTKNKAYFDYVNARYRNRRDSLPIHTIMFAEAAWSRSYRVTLPDGRKGYVRSGDLITAEEPFRKRKADSNYKLIRTLNDSITEGQVAINGTYHVLGRYGGNEYVEYDSAQGWKVTE